MSEENKIEQKDNAPTIQKEEDTTSKDNQENSAGSSDNQQSQSGEATNQQTTQIKYSGFWVRGAGYMIDSLIVAVLIFILIIPVIIVVVFTSMLDVFFINMLVKAFLSVFGLLVAWGYFTFMTHKYQATLGKMAIGVKVVTDNGTGKLTLGKVALRETVGKFVSGLLFGLGYIIAAFTGKKQALHDFIASSTVVYKDPIKGPNMVTVVIVYIIWGMMMFFAIIFMFIFSAALFALIFGASKTIDMQEDYMNGINDSVIEEINNGYYDDMDMMSTEEAQELEQMLKTLDGMNEM